MDLKKLYCDEGTCDITVYAGSGKYIRKFVAHSLVLLNSSNAFRKALKGKKRLDLIESEPDTVAQFLRFIYLGKITMRNSGRATELLDIANKYEVLSLRQKCQYYFEKNLDYDSTLLVFDRTCVGDKKQLEAMNELREKCLEYISFYTMPLMYSERLGTMTSIQSLVIIASQNKLNIRNESDLFWAVWKWGKEICSAITSPPREDNILSQIKQVLPHIRFNFMSDTETNDLPKCVQKILKSFKTHKENRANDIPNPDKKSMVRFGVPIFCRGWYDYSDRNAKMTKENRLIIFSSDKPGFLLGCKLRICGDKFEEMNFKIQFRSVKTGEVFVDEGVNPDVERESIFDHPYIPAKLVVALRRLPFLNGGEPYELKAFGTENANVWFPPMRSMPQPVDLTNNDFQISFYSNCYGVDELYFTEVDDSRLIFAVK